MESKFKVGDRVRVTGPLDKYDIENSFSVGMELTVSLAEIYDGAPSLEFEELGTEDRDFLWETQVERALELVPMETVPFAVTNSDSKDTNPKDAIGSTKLPLNVVPDTLKVYAALAFAEGAMKYGSYNWRVAGVRASIYKAALERHLAKYWNGEWADPVTGVPHLASVIACAGIILDANAAGKLTDDRPPAINMASIIDGLEPMVAHLKDLFKDKTPHHHTEADKAQEIGAETMKTIAAGTSH